MKKIQYFLEYIAYRMIEAFAAYMPEKALIPFSKALAWLGFKVIKFRQEVALSNLHIAFPEKSEAERYEIAYRSVQHFVLLFLEFMKLIRWTPERLREMIHIDNEETSVEFVERHKRAILVSGHFGSWEVAVAMLSKIWRPCAVIQTRQKNVRIDRRMADLRRKWNMEIIYKRGGVQGSLRALNNNKLVVLLGDQDGGRRGIFVPFFGKMASAPPGAALLRIRSKAPIVFAYCLRTAPFRYRSGLIPLEIDDNFEMSRENLHTITHAYTKVLEDFVRQYPEQYLWMHRRWKTPFESEKVVGSR